MQRLTLLACVANQLVTPPGGFALIDVPVAGVIYRALVSVWLRGSPHGMAVCSSPIGIDHMLKGRVLGLLALYKKSSTCGIDASTRCTLWMHTGELCKQL